MTEWLRQFKSALIAKLTLQTVAQLGAMGIPDKDQQVILRNVYRIASEQGTTPEVVMHRLVIAWQTTGQIPEWALREDRET